MPMPRIIAACCLYKGTVSTTSVNCQQLCAVAEARPCKQEQEKFMREVMRHMLFRQKALPDVPVPRNDLTKLILASYKDTKKGNVGNAIIALAQESFLKTMGMELKELRIAPISKGKSKIAGELMKL